MRKAMVSSPLFTLLLPLVFAGFTACTDEVISPLGHDGGAGGATSTGGGGAQPDKYPLLACDPLVPSFCGYPFPSNVTTIADATRIAVIPTSFISISVNWPPLYSNAYCGWVSIQSRAALKVSKILV